MTRHLVAAFAVALAAAGALTTTALTTTAVTTTPAAGSPVALTAMTSPLPSSPRQAPTSVPGCGDTDFQCGYRQGSADGQARQSNGQCRGAKPNYDAGSGSTPSASEQGYSQGFNQYCPA